MIAKTALYRSVFYVILVGLSCSVLLMIAGGIVSFAATGSLPPTPVLPSSALTLGLEGQGEGLVALGLLALLATPLLAVIAGIVVSAVKGDRIGVLAGLGVTLVMILSFFAGKR